MDSTLAGRVMRDRTKFLVLQLMRIAKPTALRYEYAKFVEVVAGNGMLGRQTVEKLE